MDDFRHSVGLVEVLTPDADRVRLEETWREQPVVLALIRHFG